MGSNAGIKDGDFDRLNIAVDLAVGDERSFGENGQVLTSAGEGQELFWGTNSATLPQGLVAGNNIVFTPSGTYNGSVETTISSTHTDTTYQGGVGISIDTATNPDTINCSNIPGSALAPDIDITTTGDLTLSSNTSVAEFKGKVEIEGSSGLDFFKTGGAGNTIRMVGETGNVLMEEGKLTLNKAGTTPAPTDSSSYTDWAIDVSNTNGHVRVKGNIICDGTIFGAVDGAITEELIEAQRIKLRTASPPIAGITGAILDTGAVISNDKSGTNDELTIDADTSGITCNTLSVKGNTNLSTLHSKTTTIGTAGQTNQTLEVLTTSVNLGDTAGNQAGNLLTYRGGRHVFTGEKVLLGSRLGHTNTACNLEGLNAKHVNIPEPDTYDNEIKYFGMEGKNITHSLCGTTGKYVILRSSTGKQFNIPFIFGGSSASQPGLEEIADFNISSRPAQATSCAINLDFYLSEHKGNPDIYCRIDSASGTTASAYPSQHNSTLIENSAVDSQNRHKFTIVITGLTIGTNYAFFPKFCQTLNDTSHQNKIMYGGAFGDALLSYEWIDDISTHDPLTEAHSFLGAIQSPKPLGAIGGLGGIYRDTSHKLLYRFLLPSDFLNDNDSSGYARSVISDSNNHGSQQCYAGSQYYAFFTIPEGYYFSGFRVNLVNSAGTNQGSTASSSLYVDVRTKNINSNLVQVGTTKGFNTDNLGYTITSGYSDGWSINDPITIGAIHCFRSSGWSSAFYNRGGWIQYTEGTPPDSGDDY